MNIQIIPGNRYTKNGISLDVHEVRNGWVYVQRWPRGVEEQELLQSLIRTPVDDFLLAIEGAEITNYTR